MADASFAVTSFLGGEWSKYSQGRFDRPDYRTALNVCLNGFPTEQGAWTRAPGSMFLQTTRNGAPGRIKAFDFKQALPYSIELTDGWLRFFQGVNLVTTNDDQAVSAISAANPAEVTTGTHGWSSGQSVYFANFDTAVLTLQNRVFTIAVTSSTKFTITDPITGIGVDGSTLGSLPGGMTVKRVHEVVSPYTAQAWKQIRIVQSELTALILHPLIAPQLLTAVPPVVGQTYYNFTLATAFFKDGPYLDPPTNGVQVTPSGTNGVVTLTLSFPTYAAGRAYSIGDFVTYTAVNYISLTDQNQGNQPDTHPGNWQAVSAGLAIGPNGFVGSDIGRLVRIKDSANAWTWGKITSIANIIDPALAGSTNIGDMTAGGGLAAAFDGNTNQTAANSAGKAVSSSASFSVYVGKNYSGASAQKIQSATIWASSDIGYAIGTKTYSTFFAGYVWQSPFWVRNSNFDYTTFTTTPAAVTLTLALRAKASAPSSATDGTLLGSSSPNALNTVISSNDQNTSWNYVWTALNATVDVSVPPPTGLPSNPQQGQVGFQSSSSLSSVSASIYVAEAQFFAPTGTGAGSAINVQILGNALADATARAVWRLGAFSNTTGWPSCGTYHEGRTWLSGAIGNRVDSSNSNDLLNFAPTNTTGTVLDSSAITAIFNAPDVNSVFWMATDYLGIVCGTQAGDWLIQATNLNNPLTPTSIQAHRYSKLGCANIEPCRADRILIVVQRYQRKLYEYFADVYSGKFGAQNVTWAARHMTSSSIAEVQYQQELYPTIWVRCNDGTLFGIVYKRESLVSSQPPNFSAPYRRVLGSGRLVESISVGASSDGTVDGLLMVTNDPSTGVRHVEMMTNLFDETSTLNQAWFLDDADNPTSTSTTSTPSQGAPYGGMTLNGLWQYNNKTVTVYSAGLDCGDYAVANGSAFVPFGDGISGGTAGGLFTQALITSLGSSMTTVVGFIYNSDGQIVRPVTPQESGARTGPALGKKRREHKYAALLNATVGISFGTDFSKLYPANFKQPNNASYAYGQAFSGVHWDTLSDDYSFDGMLCWRISRPWPATVVALEPFIQTQD